MSDDYYSFNIKGKEINVMNEYDCLKVFDIIVEKENEKRRGVRGSIGAEHAEVTCDYPLLVAL